MKLKLALLAASLLLSLVASEIALRWLRPQWGITYPPQCTFAGVFQRFDPHGYRLWPSRAFPAPNFGRAYTMTYHSNAEGFRSRRDFHEPDVRPRIVVLGDSMVFGAGVEEGERTTELVEAAEPAWRIDNLGMIGFGTDLMLRALETVALDLSPGVVVFAIFTDDIRRVEPFYQGPGFPLRRFVLEGGQLLTVPYPKPNLWDQSRIVQATNFWRVRWTSAMFPLNAAILDRFRALAAEHRFVPVILFLPGPLERENDRMRRQWVTNYTARHGVAFLDVTEALRAVGMERAYLPNDTHWSPEGHVVVAQALRSVLARLIRPAQTRVDLDLRRSEAGGGGETRGKGGRGLPRL